MCFGFMVFHRKRGPSGSSVHLLVLENVLQSGWASVSLSSSFHPKTNGQTERYSQEMALQFITSQNCSSWSRHLLQVEYTTTPFPWSPPASPHCSASTNINLHSSQSSGVGHGPLCPHSASKLFTVYMEKNLGSSPPHQHW